MSAGVAQRGAFDRVGGADRGLVRDTLSDRGVFPASQERDAEALRKCVVLDAITA